MTTNELRKFCSNLYLKIYDNSKAKVENEIKSHSKSHSIPKSKIDDIETIAQKEAIKITIIDGIKQFNNRDREPSIQAMQSFFWSTAIVLDGDFLKMPKFKSMVNGGTLEHEKNGWHGLYVFSEKYSNDRIYATDLNFKNFKDHAVIAADYWLKQRQWFDNEWRPERVNCNQ